MTRAGDEVRRQTVTFAIGNGVLVTLEPEGGFPVLDRAILQLKRRPALAQDAHGVMLTLLQGMNSTANHVVDLASAALESVSDRVEVITAGFDSRGREIDVTDPTRPYVKGSRRSSPMRKASRSTLGSSTTRCGICRTR